ncbi:hypothetical protein G9A89_003977 [Geosiphon pyriformis]|nr:hypothetical protein G9A89_003977 [Geosiphon pyriformis]
MERPLGTSPLSTPRMSHCCCCIRLKPAVVNSLFNAITGIMTFTEDESLGRFDKLYSNFSLIASIINLIITLGSIYGLFVITFAIYFSLVIAAYATHRREKEERNIESRENNGNLAFNNNG